MLTDAVQSVLEDLRPLFETALDAVVAMRSDGTIAEWNHVAERTFGWKRDQVVGRLMADLIVPRQHRAAHNEGISRFNSTGEAPVLNQRLEITAIDKEEREFPIELSITLTAASGEPLFIGFLRDISERKNSEQLLIRRAREAELLFQISQSAAESESVEPVLKQALQAICDLAGWPVGHALVVSSGDPLELVSSDIWVDEANPRFQKLREVTRSTRFTPGVGLPGVILQTGEPVWMSDTESEAVFVRKGLGYGAAFGFPLKSSGRIIAVLEFFTVAKALPDPEILLTVRTLGEQVGRVLERSSTLAELRQLNQTLEQRVFERTQEVEAAHEALRQAQKMEAIGLLTGGIAHDFNNLLTVIRGSADLLRRKELPTQKRERYVDAISDTADKAAKLTGQLLAFARRQALKPELFDAVKQIQGIADMLRTMLGSRIQLKLEANCSDCFVEADAAQFETSIVNMSVNARDAMDGEGQLTIGVAALTDSHGANVVRVTVADSGHGMQPGEVDRIFEPFYTTKEVGKGTGLGLSQVYGFVKQSDGEVSVESEVGGGTTFTITLPKVAADQVPARPQRAIIDDLPSGGRVLVVEDNADVGQFASQVLSDLGFEAVLEPNANAALDRLEHEKGRFDVVFSDVVMPGMNGVEFGRVVRERWPVIPVVLTSGYSHVLAEEPQHGFPLLQKPYSLEALSRILRQAL